MEVLILHQTLLGLELLLGVDVIVKLEGVHISGSGEVSFAAENVPHRASIAINKPDFSANFDQRMCIDHNVEMGGWLNARATEE